MILHDYRNELSPQYYSQPLQTFPQAQASGLAGGSGDGGSGDGGSGSTDEAAASWTWTFGITFMFSLNSMGQGLCRAMEVPTSIC